MHKVIRALVYADNEKEALEKAKQIFEEISGDGKEFDYYQTFDEEGSEVSGKGRYGDLPPVSKATSEDGKKFIDDGMQYTKQSFMESIEKIRNALQNFTDEELFEEKILENKTKITQKLKGENKSYELSMFKYFCNCIGQYKGSEVWLYDNDGEGIRNNRHLKDVLGEWGKGQNVWVVPADVHF